MEEKESKISTGLLYDIEENGVEEDFNILVRLLKSGVSEADLDNISFFLYETAYEVFTTDSCKKNTHQLFELLYYKYIQEIITNIGESDEKYDLVDYIIKLISDDLDYAGVREELFDIIVYPFDNLNFNQLLAQNIDFDRVKVDAEYAEKVEVIVDLLEEYNYFIRKYQDKELQKDRNFGMSKLYEYISAMEKNNPKFYCNSMLIDYILIHSAEAYAEEEQLDSQLFELVKKCVEMRTSQSDFNSFTDQGLSDLLQVIYSDKRDLNQVSELTNIIESNLQIQKIDKEKAYQNVQKLMQKEGLSEEELGMLFSEVQKIKLTSNGTIPDEIIEYLLAEMINEKSDLNCDSEAYRAYIQRIYESFGINHIPKEIKEKKSIFYFTREFIDIIDSIGTQTGNIIYLSKDLYSEFGETINTIFHENTHIEQEYNMKNGNCSFAEYMALKEQILINAIPGFQIGNYEFLFLEINAREKAVLKMLKYFLGSNRISKNLTPEMIEEIKKEYKEEVVNYIGAFQKKEKEDSDDERDVNEIFSSHLTEEVIKENPIFLLEYHEDGTVRTPAEIFNEIEKTNHRNQKILLTKILKNNGIFKKENLSRDAKFCMNYSSEDKKMEKLMSHIVANNLIKILYERYLEFELLSDNEKKEYCAIIKEMNGKLLAEPDSPFSKGITMIDKNGNKMIQTFNIILDGIQAKETEGKEELS